MGFREQAEGNIVHKTRTLNSAKIARYDIGFLSLFLFLAILRRGLSGFCSFCTVALSGRGTAVFGQLFGGGVGRGLEGIAVVSAELVIAAASKQLGHELNVQEKEQENIAENQWRRKYGG